MPLKKFRYLPHTADIAFVGYGRSFGEAIENSVLAMLNVRFDLKKLGKDGGREGSLRISEKADSKENAAWYVLQAVLSKVDASSLMAYKFDEVKVTGSSGAVKVSGVLRFKKTKKDYTQMDVKAVTPHDFTVKHGKAWSIRVVIDI